ncbi:ATP-binding protein [Fusibacter bizertensis]|uniref:ATP-binding protein n=1 Tax=Fusibacter bizertensis TaxID=1488331 RepID=A0ABT6NAH8_9FIRM|nr:ATP-binding protein [Fusibacter bizertensis]MDH8677419.1 ATP-binding protein [Fusibacter bizertensis]
MSEIMQCDLDKDEQLRVVTFEPSGIQIEIIDFEKWKSENSDSQIKIGSFLKVLDGSGNCIVTVVRSFKMIERKVPEAMEQNGYFGSFIIDTQPIGQLVLGAEKKFLKGIKNISIPPNGVSIATKDDLNVIFSNEGNTNIVFSDLLLNEEITIGVNGNKFFSKHIAVVGSTGSGKSCTVAKIIQEAKLSTDATINNTHIILFDIHGEYPKAFPNENMLSIIDGSLRLPYWLMNSEELEDMFIENSESNVRNQISQFKYAVIENKKKHNPQINITYDSPVYFSLQEVKNYIINKNNETQYTKDGTTYYAISDEKIESNKIPNLWEIKKFEISTGNSKHDKLNEKVSKSGGFTGEFNRFISRLETKMNDDRLSFILSETNSRGTSFSTDDLIEVMRSITGYNTKSNISIIDLSSLPFEVVSIVVSIVSRLIFDYSYHKTKIRESNPTPFMLVYEEAHKYIPKNSESKYKNTRIAVERISKEGRKYGISSMVVSQRPSELSATVFSQCNNFVVMRLNNPEDQQYVKRLLPEAVISYGDALSSLEQREALLVGDSLNTPCIVRIRDANPTPHSDDVQFYTEWQKHWHKVSFEDIINRINLKKCCEE